MVLLLAETAQAVSEAPMGWPEAFMFVGCAFAGAWLYTRIF